MDRHAKISLAIIIAALVVLVHFVLGHSFSIYDDAYIYFRYADNLEAGCGPTFNCGDPPVEGFTSPLFLGLLTLGGMLSGDVEAWSQILGPVCLGVALVLAVQAPLSRAGRSLALERGPATWAAAAIAVVLAADDYVLLNAVSGLETGLAAAIVVALARAVWRRDVVGTCVFAVVGILLRPEHGVFVLLLPLLPWVRTRRAVAGVLLALALMSIVRYAVFAELLPNTYWAKAGGTAVHARLGVEYLLQIIDDFPFVCLAPLALAHRAHRREHAFLLGGAALWCLYFLRSGGDHFMYSRLAFPLVPMLTVLATLGLYSLAARIERRPWLRSVTLLLPAVLCAGRAQLQHTLVEGHGFTNVERWTAVGRWLAEHHPGETIAAVPVGALAYHSGLRTLDLVGITSKEVARAGGRVPPQLMRRAWLGHERHATEWIVEQAPELIITTKFRPVPWHDLAETKAGFFADWLLLQEIKARRVPYRVYDAPIAPGVHWLMFRRAAPARPADESSLTR